MLIFIYLYFRYQTLFSLWWKNISFFNERIKNLYDFFFLSYVTHHKVHTIAKFYVKTLYLRVIFCIERRRKKNRKYLLWYMWHLYVGTYFPVVNLWKNKKRAILSPTVCKCNVLFVLHWQQKHLPDIRNFLSRN